MVKSTCSAVTFHKHIQPSTLSFNPPHCQCSNPPHCHHHCFHVMMVAFVLQLFLGLLLLVVKLRFVSNGDCTGLLNGWGDDLVPNYDLLSQLGFVRIGDCDHDAKNF